MIGLIGFAAGLVLGCAATLMVGLGKLDREVLSPLNRIEGGAWRKGYDEGWDDATRWVGRHAKASGLELPASAAKRWQPHKPGRN
jgi:hypothetical protein